MRWITRLRPSLAEHERGAAAVTVALLMVVLVGFAALAVDAGRLVSSKSQLQNGADASALAIAQYCSKNAWPCTPPPALAPGLTKDNSLDQSAVVQSITYPTKGQVSVTTSTPAGGLKLVLAGAIGQPSAQVTATATAAWGPPGGGKSFPLALSMQCWDLTPTTTAGTIKSFAYKPGQTCTGPSGTAAPGGWGWLSPDGTSCTTTTTTGDVVIGYTNPGNTMPNSGPTGACTAVLQSWVDTLTAGQELDVVLPVFSATSGTGSNVQYTIAGYATLRVYGWQLDGGSGKSPGAFRNTASALTAQGLSASLACSGGNDRCIIGQFIRYTIADPNFSGGGGADLGSNIIALIN
ncbi:TadE/TadG family type IV pilus assembly protein [Sinomonas sp. B1-1]|uniref:TadE/TadG family type IV pilus assembly protein n=1 Tax=Sinomonas sp. B1-1 TaxID=3141454 RepID=UPI003D2AC1CA